MLHWLAQASSFAQLAALYAIGKSTVVAVVHQGVDVLRAKFVPEAIRFPTGSELDQVMVDFEALCGLPCCGGALALSCPSGSQQIMETPIFVTNASAPLLY